MNHINPAHCTDSLVELMLGGMPVGRIGYPLHCRVRYFDLQRRLEQIHAEDATPPPLPPGLGHALCEGLDIKPGPAVGEAIAWLTSEIEAGRLSAGESTEHYVMTCRKRAENSP